MLSIGSGLRGARDDRRSHTWLRSQSRLARHRAWHHVNDVAWDGLVIVQEEHPKAGTRLLNRDSLLPAFAGTPVIKHRLIAAVADRDAVNWRPAHRYVVCLPFEYPEDDISKILVGLVVRRSSDLIVLLDHVLGFLEDRYEIVRLLSASVRRR